MISLPAFANKGRLFRTGKRFAINVAGKQPVLRYAAAVPQGHSNCPAHQTQAGDANGTFFGWFHLTPLFIKIIFQ
jgi:hypothetical protein